MLQESTIEYNMENWREVAKDWEFIIYVTDESEKTPSTIYIRDTSSSNESGT
jgi:hypothetical protein